MKEIRALFEVFLLDCKDLCKHSKTGLTILKSCVNKTLREPINKLLIVWFIVLILVLLGGCSKILPGTYTKNSVVPSIEKTCFMVHNDTFKYNLCLSTFYTEMLVNIKAGNR